MILKKSWGQGGNRPPGPPWICQWFPYWCSSLKRLFMLKCDTKLTKVKALLETQSGVVSLWCSFVNTCYIFVQDFFQFCSRRPHPLIGSHTRNCSKILAVCKIYVFWILSCDEDCTLGLFGNQWRTSKSQWSCGRGRNCLSCILASLADFVTLCEGFASAGSDHFGSGFQNLGSTSAMPAHKFENVVPKKR